MSGSILLRCLLVLTCLANVSLLPAAEPSPADLEFFEKQVRPVLVQSCQKCHGETKQEGGLRLDSAAGLKQGGDSGPVVEAGAPDKSSLIEAIRYEGDLKMPPKAKLAPAEIEALTEWVRKGATWPVDKTGPKPSAEFNLAARKAEQWVYQPLQTATPPSVRRTGWPRNEIDRFILARLEAAELEPAPPADRRTLLRRVTFDLIGLPPTPAEIDAFLADDAPQALERVVNRLLDSPHYGERWGRHWLDLVRYAETCGHEFDFELPNAFEYRDYVIRAFNADVPYNQFVLEHVAGDLLPEPRRHPTEHFNESLIATGFWFLGEATHSPVDVRADEDTRVDNQIDVFGKTFFAQTLGCARCHDHKFDAISTKDYYALAGYLQSSRFHVACVDSPAERLQLVRELEQLREREQKLQQELAAETARPSATRVAEYLQAALAVLHPADTPVAEPTAEAIAAVARARQLDEQSLGLWVSHLRGPGRMSPADPWHLWSLLAQLPGPLTAERYAAFVRDQSAALVAAAEQAAAADAQTQVFEDFSRPDYAGWFVTGDAFGSGPVALRVDPGNGVFSLPAVSWLGTQAAHSGALSHRLEGTLRSKTFTIEKNHVLYHMGGRGAKVNLIIDSFRLIQYPIYGGLTIGLDTGDKLQWYVQDVSKWVGHNAYIEVLDQGDGFAIIDRVLCSDGGPPAEPANPVSECLLRTPGVNSPASLAQACADLCARAWGATVERPAGGRDEAALASLQRFLTGIPLTGTLPASQVRDRSAVQAARTELAREKSTREGAIRYARRAMSMTDGSPEDDRVHLRGSAHRFGEVVPRRLAEALGGAEQPPPASGSGRLELAHRMIDAGRDVLARVLVNRIWKQHFGAGLVETPDDFGNMGQPPTHPELLDFLAAQFIRDGWSIKQLHRRLLLSQTYQMSSHDDGSPRAAEVDPQNRLWHRMHLRRLESEAIRDAVLAVSGRLNRTQFGRGVMPYLTEFMIGRGRPGQSGPLDGDGRRTVYLSVRRNFLVPMLLAFDSPIPFSTNGRRSVSNVPAQALALMNNPFVIQQSEVWAQRVVAQASAPADRVRNMYVAAFGRPPTDSELQEALEFVREQTQQYPAEDQVHPWADLAHVLFNVKEFIFIE